MITRGNINVGFVICLGLVIWGFFLPWIEIESSFFNRLTRVAGGEESVVMKKITGYEIPKMANSKKVKAFRQVAHVFVKDTRNIGMKSYAVYMIPAMGMLLFWLFLWAETKKKAANILVMFLAWSFSGFLAYRLLSVNASNTAALAIFSYGLWISIIAIAVMGLCASFKMVVSE